MGEELWTVEFSLSMNDIEKDVPNIDGEMLVRGNDIFDVLDKAEEQLKKFGFDHYVVHGANREGYIFRKKKEKENNT